jgi:serine/threonine-protein kinase
LTIQLAAIEGKYEILSKISEGGMGAVYKVRHRLLEEVRVIKVMRQHLATDSRARERFIHEARLAGGLGHANIVQVYDFAIDDSGNAFLVLEYIEGITLQELLKVMPRPPIGLTLEIARQSLAAIGCLHERGIVHRDISPDNIMVSLDEHSRVVAKLIDLGIAKLVESEAGLTATGMFVGKVKYSSPEHFKAAEGVRVDSRSDLYSFGVVLYELLTGQHPLPGTGVSNLIAGHLFSQPTPFAKTDPDGRIPAGLQSIVYRALAKSPEQRPASARAMAEELAGFSDQFEISTTELQQELDRRRAVAAAQEEKASPGSTQRLLDAQIGRITTPTRPMSDTAAMDQPTMQLESPGSATRSQAETELELAPEAPTVALAPAAATSRQLPAPRSRPLKLLLGLAAATVILVVLLVIWLMPGTPVAVPQGVLVIDAVPWAEVTAVIGESGEPVTLPQPSHTPLQLALPPGTYQVMLKNGDTEQQDQVQVLAGQTTPIHVKLADLTAEDLLTSLGL